MSQVAVEHRISAKSIKCTLVLSAEDIIKVNTPDGKPRCVLRIDVAGRSVTADLNAKSVRKVIATIREHGPEGIAGVILQGKLGPKDEILEAGLSAQPKVAKPAAEAVSA